MNPHASSRSLWSSPFFRTLFVAALVCNPATAQITNLTATQSNPLRSVRNWMYQLQGMEDPVSLAKLAQSPYDLLVIEPTFTLKGESSFDAKAMVAKLKAAKPNRLVVAYVDIGEAERFRTYWEKHGSCPQRKDQVRRISCWHRIPTAGRTTSPLSSGIRNGEKFGSAKTDCSSRSCKQGLTEFIWTGSKPITNPVW
jgi:hypothetical protein